MNSVSPTFVEDADALYAEYAAQSVEFTRGLGNMPWHKREFVVNDCDGRLLAFGATCSLLPSCCSGRSLDRYEKRATAKEKSEKRKARV
jgi:hypothetical protein